MVPRFQINKRPSPLITNEDNTIEVIINEVYDNDKDEKEENRKSIFFLEKVKKLQASKKLGASSPGVSVKYQSVILTIGQIISAFILKKCNI